MIQAINLYFLILKKYLIFKECLTLSKNATKIVNSKREALLAALQKHLDEQMPNKIEASIRMAELILRISNVHVKLIN